MLYLWFWEPVPPYPLTPFCPSAHSRPLWQPSVCSDGSVSALFVPFCSLDFLCQYDLIVFIFPWLIDLALYPLGPPMLSQTWRSHFFLLLSNIPLCLYPTSSVSVSLSIGVSVASLSWLLQIMLQETKKCIYVFKLVFCFLWAHTRYWNYWILRYFYF